MKKYFFPGKESARLESFVKIFLWQNIHDSILIECFNFAVLNIFFPFSHRKLNYFLKCLYSH